MLHTLFYMHDAYYILRYGNIMPVAIGLFIQCALCFRCLEYLAGTFHVPFRLTTVPLPTDMIRTSRMMFTIARATHCAPYALQVEDIVDTGLTGKELVEYFEGCRAASVEMVALLSKPSRRETDFEASYVGFEVEDKFVVGMGLDFDEQYRSLGYVGVLRSS